MSGKIIIIIVAGAVIISGAAYVAITQWDVLNEQGLLGLLRLTDRGRELKVFGCCLPFCEDMTEASCGEKYGGNWQKEECSTFEECEMGCCMPFCEQTSREICTQKAGSDFLLSTECDSLDECDLGCCVPDCVYETKEACDMRTDNTWHEDDECDEFDECDEVCCKEVNLLMTQEQCDEKGGTSADPDECQGYRAEAFTEAHIDLHATEDRWAEYEFNVFAQTCDKNIGGRWVGTYTWTWTYKSEFGAPFTQQTEEPIIFFPDASGNFTFEMGDFATVYGSVNENDMVVEFVGPGVVEQVTASGPVEKGIEIPCHESKELN